MDMFSAILLPELTLAPVSVCLLEIRVRLSYVKNRPKDSRQRWGSLKILIHVKVEMIIQCIKYTYECKYKVGKEEQADDDNAGFVLLAGSSGWPCSGYPLNQVGTPHNQMHYHLIRRRMRRNMRRNLKKYERSEWEKSDVRHGMEIKEKERNVRKTAPVPMMR